jgi:hypothetical protein
MSEKQTAVDFLVEKIVIADVNGFSLQISKLQEWSKQAKEMEKQQIIEAYNQGSLDTYKKEPKNGQGNKYYNETFKK